MAKIVICCLFAVMVQTITGQCIGPYGPGFPGPGLPGPGPALEAYAPLAGLPGVGPCTLPGIAASNGGGFLVTSSSPISPSGLSVQTDSMAIEGPLAVSGQLPFLGVVALEGPLPVVGQGAVAYGCGTGNVGILNEVGPNLGPFNAYPDVNPGYGYGYPNGYGCGPFY
ncbi:chorion class CB protein PC404-like [Epargyreus clarus]|uniref:chorion class CB protein PC404-like n=1 Tax=Epargyreus clarus TaxID=520877 RepID=UPI003C2C8E18